MLRRRHRDHFDIADVDSFNPRHVRVHRSGDADAGDTRVHELGDCAESLDVQPQGNRGKFRFECPHGVRQPRGRKHHVDDECYLGLQPTEQALHARAQVVDPSRHRPGF